MRSFRILLAITTIAATLVASAPTTSHTFAKTLAARDPSVNGLSMRVLGQENENKYDHGHLSPAGLTAPRAFGGGENEPDEHEPKEHEPKEHESKENENEPDEHEPKEHEPKENENEPDEHEPKENEPDEDGVGVHRPQKRGVVGEKSGGGQGQNGGWNEHENDDDDGEDGDDEFV